MTPPIKLTKDIKTRYSSIRGGKSVRFIGMWKPTIGIDDREWYFECDVVGAPESTRMISVKGLMNYMYSMEHL